ncbi:hypothetical protein DM02DRAFT_734263 [Periconia macrospinosa]|uniref:Uncharacterized protein n=1 Tax=Periconia macrospinosa TaxID=97972 RepID=A0A2V1CZI5_9PLEO|nr:hypothetical protein DM02DRAFT_734263 [Periconia macrospinosa]
MECQTCSSVFQTADILNEHVGYYQSRAQYLLRELAICLAHAGAHDDDDNINIDRDSDKDTSSNFEEVDDGLTDHDLRCPLQTCERLTEFTTLKELQRHYAIHVSCHEVCKLCSRVFDRASTYLHHTCKKQGDLNGSVLRRRKTVRKKVDRSLIKARNSNNHEKKRPNPMDLNTPHVKRRKIAEPVISEHQALDRNDEGQITTPGGIALSTMQPPSFFQIDEGTISNNADMFPENPTGTSDIAPASIPHDVSEYSNFTETPLLDIQAPYAYASSNVEYGSKAPAMYSEIAFGSKAPAMCMNTAFGSKMPAMYSGTVFGSKAPLMCSNIVGSIPLYDQGSVLAPETGNWAENE